MAFPASPTNGQIYSNKKYNSTKGAWVDAALIDSDPWHYIGAVGEPQFQNG